MFSRWRHQMSAPTVAPAQEMGVGPSMVKPTTTQTSVPASEPIEETPVAR